MGALPLTNGLPPSHLGIVRKPLCSRFGVGSASVTSDCHFTALKSQWPEAPKNNPSLRGLAQAVAISRFSIKNNKEDCHVATLLAMTIFYLLSQK